MTLSSGPESFGRLNVQAMVAKLIDSGAPILTGEGIPTSGPSGTFAEFPVSKGAIYIDISVGGIYVNQGVQGNPFWQIQSAAGLSNPIGHSGIGLIRCRFDAQVDDVSVGIHEFLDANGLPIPLFDMSYVLFGWLDTKNALASAGAAEVSIGVTQEPGEFQSLVAITGIPWTLGRHVFDLHNDFSDPTKYLPIFSDDNMSYDIDVAPLTGGEFEMFLYYIQIEG